MENKLVDNIKSWLEKEGYPLEFKTANIFKKYKFSTQQSYFTRNEKNEPREIDVLATKNIQIGKKYLRIEHIVECKWSKDKPWILFKADETNQFAPSALIAQLIASDEGNALTWLNAGRKELHSLSLFQGKGFTFSGRQAFTKGQDLFYSSVQGVISKCLDITRFYNKYEHESFEELLPVVTFPIIIVDGDIFEAEYDNISNELHYEKVKNTRLIWKGNEGRTLHTIVDVVSVSHLDEFLENRTKEMDILIKNFSESFEQMIQCYNEKTDENLVIHDGPRGFLGVPKVLKKLKKHILSGDVNSKDNDACTFPKSNKYLNHLLSIENKE